MNMGKRIAEEAGKWVMEKVPFRHRGTSKFGCDCTGFIIGVMQSLGYLKDYKLPFYSYDWCVHKDEENILAEIIKYGDEISVKQIRPGDVVLFQFGRAVSHAGIYVSGGIFAHNSSDAQKCSFAMLHNSLWEQRLRKAFRFSYDKVA